LSASVTAAVAAEKAIHIERIAKLEGEVATLKADKFAIQAKYDALNSSVSDKIQIAVQKAQLSASEKLFHKFSEGVALGQGRHSGSSSRNADSAPLFTPFIEGAVPRMARL
jgi:hypothetical protein